MSFDSKIQKDPVARIKGLTVVDKTIITHIFDYESARKEHVIVFKKTLEKMKMAQNSGKKIKYQLGYSNFCFELWLLLHKLDCNSSFANIDNYLSGINSGYHERFRSLSELKRETNFKRLLSTLSLDEVANAVRRSKTIMQRNKDNGYTLQEYKGYEYYNENPSLSLGEVMEKILEECDWLQA